MYCKRCGYQNEEGARFCGQCRQKLTEEESKKKIWYGLLAATVLIAGVLVGAQIIGRGSGTVKQSPERLTETEAKTTLATESQAASRQDALVLAYSQKTDTAPANYYYNEAGQLVRKVQEQWNQVTQYEYHSNGVLKKETVIRGDEPYTVVEYDDHGNPTIEYTITGNGQTAETELYYFYVNRYDAQGRLVECAKVAEGSYEEAYRYTYQQDGSWDEEFSYSTWYQGEKLLHTHCVKSYSPEGILLLETCDVEDYISCEIVTKYSFDNHGNLAMKVHDSHKEYLEQREELCYSHTYDGNGLLLKTEVSSSSYWSTPEYEERSEEAQKQIITYTYDTEKRITRKDIYHPDGDFTIENIWEYDETGNLIRFYGVPDDEYSWYVEEIWQYQPLSEVLYSE